MENIIPIHQEYKKLSDKEVQKLIEQGDIKVHLYPILAMRMEKNLIFRNVLLQEALKKENLEFRLSGIIKLAWIPILSIIEYGDIATKQELKNVLKNWPAKEYESFLEYFRNEKDILLYVQPS